MYIYDIIGETIGRISGRARTRRLRGRGRGEYDAEVVKANEILMKTI